MAQTCIVCLGDLRALEDLESSDAAVPEAPGVKPEVRSLRNTTLTGKNALNDDEIIAHLLPCGHNLHNSCLKPWVERANSCPICRTTFNMVELNLALGGEVIDTYGVQDKTQQAEIDPTLVVEYDPVLEDQCELCAAWAATDEMVSCHFCEYTVHAICAGFDSADDTQDTWVCTDCTIRFGSADRPSPRGATRRLERSTDQAWRRSAATPGHNRSTRPAQNDGMWARIWLGVSRQLDLDLDFPFDHDEDIDGQRTPAQIREFSRWQRRFELADRQGNSRRFQELATRLRSRERTPVPQPAAESQDVLRAWNAFEKARESQEAPSSVRRKRRRSDAASTPGPENDVSEPQQLKRPRLRLPASRDRAASTAEPTPDANDDTSEPTFLSSLLKDVEQQRVSTAASPDTIHQQHSPRNSSPVRSPVSSERATPQLPTTPPPHYNRSPPLSSTIAPPLSPPGLTFSPFSPIGANRRQPHIAEQLRGRQRDGVPPTARKSSSSPGAQLSYSSKEEIQRMVKLAIGSRYRDGDITKDQYTEINRDVSRKMYDMIGSAARLGSGDARAKWQDVAEKEVALAITLLQTVIDESGSGSGS